MSNRYKKGDLVFVPSGLTLLQFADTSAEDTSSASVKNFTRTVVPSPVIIVENEAQSPYCSILYNGERWYVPKREVYPITENKNDN
jgi:hypothetical protein